MQLHGDSIEGEFTPISTPIVSGELREKVSLLDLLADVELFGGRKPFGLIVDYPEIYQ